MKKNDCRQSHEQVLAALDDLTAKIHTVVDAGKKAARTFLIAWIESQDATTAVTVNQHQQNDGSLKTINEIAAYLKTSKNTIRRWIDERDFPSRRAGDDYRFDLNEVDRWTLENHTNLSKNNGHKC